MVTSETATRAVGLDVPATAKDKVVFCDYQRVLCFTRFWDDIRSDDLHPDYDLVETIWDEGERMGFHDWMRSRKFDTDDVIDSGIERFIGDGGKLDVSADEKGLELRHLLEKGASEAPLDEGMLEWLRGKRESGFYTVLATDNMTVGIDGIRKRADIDKAFDEVISSSDMGRNCLKSDDPQKFFGAFLEEHGLTFADAVLIDDHEPNIDKFEEAGGHGLVWTKDSEPVDASLLLYDVFGEEDGLVKAELDSRAEMRGEGRPAEPDGFDVLGEDDSAYVPDVADEDDSADFAYGQHGANMPEDVSEAADEWLDESKPSEFDWNKGESGWERFKAKVKGWFS